MDQNEKIRLSALFARQREVDIGVEGEGKVSLKCLPLDDIDKVFESFDKIIALLSEGSSPVAIAFQAFRDVKKLLPLCLVDPEVMEILPATALPFLLEAIVEMNFTEAMLVKWKSLVENLAAYFPGSVGQGSPPS